MFALLKGIEENRHEKAVQPTKLSKRHLFALLALMVIVVFVAFFAISAANSAQTLKVAAANTQYKLNVAYAYTGKGVPNSSTTFADATLSPDSQYPTAVILNITRLPGAQICSCDAEIEVYNVQIVSNTGVVENNCYFVGTNYNQSFAKSDLNLLFEHVENFVRALGATGSFGAIRGNFEYNWTDNSSILSLPIGSTGCFSTFTSSLGLWSSGAPNSISVTVKELAT